MTPEEQKILDRIVDIIEQEESPFNNVLSAEWQQLNKDYRALQEDKCYGLGVWHRGYEIEFYGSKILSRKASQEEYEDMLTMFSGELSIEDYKKKWGK